MFLGFTGGEHDKRLFVADTTTQAVSASADSRSGEAGWGVAKLGGTLWSSEA